MKRVIGLILISALLALTPLVASAATPDLWGACEAGDTSPICQSQDEEVSDFVTPVINFMLALVGVLAVVMIIVGGIKYITSAGDTSKVTAAKNTILYAVIGLVVAILAYAIVSWVNSTVTSESLLDPSTAIGYLSVGRL
ncbi:hypothetical protein B7Y94_02845 [Candidatus Saccharibacteria bacterium 32-49-12]|nr:MAG: hypothetical protein B7Y94_02845 [Candidatus Saccharibacteria bacterium 32-49-12]